MADARVARCLYERAVGYSCTVERTVLHDGEERTLKNVVHYPPDTRACIFWLRNRRRAAWSEKSGPGRTTTPAVPDACWPSSMPRASAPARRRWRNVPAERRRADLLADAALRLRRPAS